MIYIKWNTLIIFVHARTIYYETFYTNNRPSNIVQTAVKQHDAPRYSDISGFNDFFYTAALG